MSPSPSFGVVESPADIGRLVRAVRKQRGLTLEDVYAATALSTRFLSEMERGKEHASVGRVLHALHSLGLDVLVMPRDEAQAIVRSRSTPDPVPEDDG